ncbi:potassium transporter TrkG [Amaricoccus tamworthensis]|uniref:potassium transporter TrkG n=1 Tax=Amaricoccus tamworthensis TaxID=57002 RepID=UPI003C7D078F
MSYLRQFPAFVLLLLFSAALMMVPAIDALIDHNMLISRTFFYHSVFFAVISVLLGLATTNWHPRVPERYHLLTLLMVYILLPIFLAAPLVPLVPNMDFMDLYFEMLSSLSTTGASVFERPALISDTIHLWRSLVGWLGGLIVLVTTFAVLAPLNLGGFEISDKTGGQYLRHGAGTIEEASRRIVQKARTITPIYVMGTFVLALILTVCGDRPFVALCHAMATVSTSGVSPIGGVEGAGSGRLGEIAIAIFLLSAVSQKTVFRSRWTERIPRFSDPQMQLMLICVLGITVVLFCRNFIGAAEVDRQDNLAAAAQGVWGSIFTILSFLTTTGFESSDWRTMQVWSGLQSPGLILLGVAVMGGGIATTAGGVKLLRVYALYRLGLQEMDLLVHPSSVRRQGHGDKMISDRGPQTAFVFLMLFLATLSLLLVALSATGLGFERSLTLAIASLTTTGPAILTLSDGFGYADLNDAAQVIFSAGMIIGRMEALVIIALFNPAYWRN